MDKPAKNDILYRPATIDDCPAMREIISHWAKKEVMLPKSIAQLTVMVHAFFVAEHAGQIIGTCGIKIWPDATVEIISLGIKEEFHGRGIGKNLVRLCVNRAKELGGKKIFSLTASPEFFAQIGFGKADYGDFPAKIWSDCVSCARNAGNPGDPRCNETPMILEV